MRRAVVATALAAAVLVIVPGARDAAAQGVNQRLAPIDLTGTWVSVVTEDWHLRMIAPPKGDFEGLPLNAEGLRVGGAWDLERDEAARSACKAARSAGCSHETGAISGRVRRGRGAGRFDMSGPG